MDGPAPNQKVRGATGNVATQLWMTSESPADIASHADRSLGVDGTSPPPTGSILRVVDFPPARDPSSISQSAVLKEMGIGHQDVAGSSRHPYMHRTSSVDYAIILEGEIDMLLDDSEVHMRAGDIMVQQGTNHAWINRGTSPCRICFVLIGANDPPVWKRGD
jgi:mannose-6-phosphate isomerase-like protein (cupin superfamily)